MRESNELTDAACAIDQLVTHATDAVSTLTAVADTDVRTA